MPKCFEPRLEILPAAQRQVWPALAPAPRLSYVLYGGTAIALYLGHRISLDFDFFRSASLDKEEIRREFEFLVDAKILQDEVNKLVASADLPAGAVKVSFFGGVGFGRVSDPLLTTDHTLLVASPIDLMATKLKTILDRAQSRDYKDIAALLHHGVALELGLSAFRAVFKGEPAVILRAIGFFGDVPSLDRTDKEILVTARDRVRDLPEVTLVAGTLAVPIGECDEVIRPFIR
jgi:Nucleotidyl transferase AbiEii toxin, Type IV TA system